MRRPGSGFSGDSKQTSGGGRHRISSSSELGGVSGGVSPYQVGVTSQLSASRIVRDGPGGLLFQFKLCTYFRGVCNDVH